MNARLPAATWSNWVSRSTRSTRFPRSRLLDLLAVLLPVLIVCARGRRLLAGEWVGALRPVDRLSQTAEQMRACKNLTLRLLGRADRRCARTPVDFTQYDVGALTLTPVQTSRRFLAKSASHELRTPLTVIKGELQELAGESTLTKRDLRGAGRQCSRSKVARLEHLVSGLLVLSRLDAGEPQRDWADVDFGGIGVEHRREQMRLMAGRSRH